MFSVDLSNGTRVTASLALLQKPPVLVVEQKMPETGTVVGIVTIPLSDLKKTAEAVATIVKAFRG